MQGRRVGGGQGGREEVLSDKHLASSRSVLGTRRQRGFLSPASVSPGPARWAIPPGPPAADQDPAPCGRTARSMAALCRADRRSKRESRKPTRTGTACRRASAPAVRWQDVSRLGGQPQPPDASIFPPQLGAPCREGLWQIRGGRGRQTGPESSIVRAHRSDDLVSFSQNVFKAVPAITLGLSLSVLKGLDKLRPRRLPAPQQVHARPDDFVDVAETARSHSFGRELLEIRWQGQTVHGWNIGQRRAAGKNFADSASLGQYRHG